MQELVVGTDWLLRPTDVIWGVAENATAAAQISHLTTSDRAAPLSAS